LKRIALTALAVAGLAFAQEHPRPAEADGHAQAGGAEAVHPGGQASTHAEDAARQGEGHEAEAMPNEIWWKWANFAILALVLGWLIRKNAGPFFAARSEQIQSGIAEAAKVRAEAEQRAAEIERRVGNLGAEVESLRQRSREEIAREGERVRAETETSIRKIQAQSEAEIASATKHAAQELKAYSAKLALDLAERQIRDRMTDDTQEQITDAFVTELRGKTGHA
jgi:F-type H+-transporting ATPase subunit b